MWLNEAIPMYSTEVRWLYLYINALTSVAESS